VRLPDLSAEFCRHVVGQIPQSGSNLKDTGSLSHIKWECKYHVVFIPKYRRKAMYKELWQYLGNLFHDLAGQKECRIEEGHLCPDQVHMLISILPKYSVSPSDGIHQRQKCDCDCSYLRRETEEFRWATLLGTGLLRFNSGMRGGNGAAVHPTTRSGGSTH
jgi:REP element-mobilizing transposase RayT